MARSRSRRATYTNLYGWITTVGTLLAGAGFSGWAAPDLPVVGPFVQQFLGPFAQKTAPDGSTATRIPGESADRAVPPYSADSPPRPSDSGPHEPNPLGPGALGPGSVERASVERPVSHVTPATASTISIASYNIQVFGSSKLQQPAVRNILAQVVRKFDVVAIQEVRSQDDTILPQFVQLINAEGSRYDFVIGPRLGRTNSKEQYAFVFNTDHVEVDRSSVITLNDPSDLLHREPLVARFRAIANPREAGFTFWLVNIHTDPDEVPQEIDALVDVLQAMVQARPDEDDVIVLGDLNADETKFGRLKAIPGITWTVPRGTPTNTRGKSTYDNFLFLEHATTEFTGRWGVVNMQKAFSLSLDDALKVSDHLPIWAEFRARESMPANTANRDRVPPR